MMQMKKSCVCVCVCVHKTDSDENLKVTWGCACGTNLSESQQTRWSSHVSIFCGVSLPPAPPPKDQEPCYFRAFLASDILLLKI
jgi:hypothetical protein